VRSVEPYVGRQIGFENDGKMFATYVVGAPAGDAITGPVQVVSGSDTIADGEIALNRSLADASKLSIGDTVDLRGTPFRVSALTDGGDMVMYQYSLVTMHDAFALQGSDTIVNFFLVQLDPGASVPAVSAGIHRTVPEAEAWTPSKVVTENQGPIKDTFLPVIGVLVAIGFIVGTAVIGLTTYSGVVERRREYGVLKALGADGWATFRTVLIQSSIAGAIGYLVGVAATVALGRWLPGVVPQFAVQLAPRYVIWVMLSAAGMVAASVALPVMRMSRIDAAEVFQS
jgi:putative ABC transport system permease protein